MTTMEYPTWRGTAVDKLSKLLGNAIGRIPDHIDLSQPTPPGFWEQQEADSRREDRERKVEILLKRLPLRYRDATPNHLATREWIAAYDAGKPGNMVIVGDGGTGKTWEAAALSAAMLKRFVPVTFLKLPELADNLREFDAGTMKSYQVSPILVLDDLGVEKISDWITQELYTLLDYRHDNLLPTIVTTNLTPKEITARYDERIYRRITEGAAVLRLAPRPA